MDRLAVPIQEEDHWVIRDWYRRWGMKPIVRELLPPTGLIVPGVCAGFLYLTNCGLGLIETYISNPEASPELRDEGLDELTHALIALAKEKGVTYLRCETQNRKIAERAKRFDFIEIDMPTGRQFIRRI